jgi:hypothetical protein
MTTLQARLHHNRQIQDSVAGLIIKHNDQAEIRDALVAELLRLVAESAGIERQLLAA